MLISKQGINIFNDYSISATLRNQIDLLKKEILAGDFPENEDSYIAEKIKKYQIESLEFEPENIYATQSEKDIPAKYFPQTYFVDAGKSYPKPVLTFHLPFKGDSSLLRYQPSSRLLWTDQVGLGNNEIFFDFIVFEEDAVEINRQKDYVVKNILQQQSSLSGEINSYNISLQNTIKQTLFMLQDKKTKQTDFLSKLGVPIKNTPPEKVPHSSYSAIKVNKKTNESSVATEKGSKEKYDVFISHATEDKEFVGQLVEKLTEKNIKVWYDNTILEWGDDLRGSIDKGLLNSKFGIVVFSKAFLSKKKWTEYELNGLFAREKAGTKVILPIWHNITREDVLEYAPSFADRIAKRSEKDSIEEIAKSLSNLIK